MIDKDYAINGCQVNKLRWTALTSSIIKHLWKESRPVNWLTTNLLLTLANTVILGSELHGTHDHTLLCDALGVQASK
jgi:hypothetical protein